MADGRKTKKQLISELQALRRELEDRPPATSGGTNDPGIEFQTLVKLMPDIVYAIDAQGLFTYISDAVGELGYKPADLKGRHFETILHPDDTPAVSRSMVLPRLKGTVTGDKKAPKLFDERRTGKRRTQKLEVRLLASKSAPAQKSRAEAERVGLIYSTGEVTAQGWYGDKEAGRLAGTIGIIHDITDYRNTGMLLKEERDLNRSFLEVAGVMIVVLDPAERVTLINQTACSILGVDSAWVVGRKWSANFIPRRDRSEWRDHFGTILNKDPGSGTLFESTIQTRGKARRLIAWHTKVMRDAAGKPQYLIVSGTDITESRRMEDALRASEQKYHNLFEMAPAAVLTVDLKGFITGCNASALRMLQCERSDMIGRHFTKMPFTSIKHLPEYAKTLSAIIRGKIPEPFETPFTRKDGRQAWSRVHISITEDAEGRKAIQALVSDITDEREALEALRASEEKFRSLATLLPQTVFEIDLEGKLLFVNLAAIKLFGYSDADIRKGINVFDLMAAEDKPRIRKNIGAILEGRFTEGNEYTAIRKDGVRFPVIIYSTPVMDGKKPIGLRGILADITRTKQSENLIRVQRDIALAIAASGDLEDTIRTCTQSLLTVPGIDACGIYLTDDRSGEIRLVHAEGVSDAFLKTRRVFGPGSRQAELITAGQPFFANYRDVPKELRRGVRKGGLKCLGIVPIEFDRRSIGCLNIASRSEEEFSAEIQHFLGSIAPHLGSVFSRAGMEDSLRISEDKYRGVVENANEGILVAQDGLLTFCNPKMGQMTGFKQSELEMQPFPAFIHPDDRDMVIDRYRRRLAGEKLEDVYSFRIMHKKGHVLWVEIRVVLIEWEGRPATLNFLTDVTYRMQAEEDLRRSEKRFRSLIENALTGISIFSKGKMVYRNPEQDRLLGSDATEFIAGHLANIYPEDEAKVRQFYTGLKKGLAPETISNIDFRFFPSGEGDTPRALKWVNCRASQIEFEGREAVLVNMIDITRTKHLEELLRHHDKMISLGRVSAGIAHEIRNPLSGVNIYLETLQKKYEKGGDMHRVPEIIKQILSASGKIETVISRVMDFARPSEPHMRELDINIPVQEAVDLSSVTLRKKGVKLTVDFASDLPVCWADIQMIEQVILNLINNAVDAMGTRRKKRAIRIRTFADSGNVCIQVADSGPGVPRKSREDIFEPFFTTKHGSSGIGLSLCRRIVMDHEGSLTVTDSELGGADFVISLPGASKEGTDA